MNNQWISVKDRYPDKEDCYLVILCVDEDYNIPLVLYYTHDKKFEGITDIAYWMTIPELPKNI